MPEEIIPEMESGQVLCLERFRDTNDPEGYLMIWIATFQDGLMIRSQIISRGKMDSRSITRVADTVMVSRFRSLQEIVNVPTYIYSNVGVVATGFELE